MHSGNFERGEQVNSFGELERVYRETPFFRLLVVGPSAERRDSVLDRARKLGCFGDSMEPIAADNDFAAVAARVENGYAVGDDGGCLIVVLDLAKGADDAQRVEMLAKHKKAVENSPQGVIFALGAADAQLSFSAFVDFIANNVAGFGDETSCAATLQQWCGRTGDLQGPLDLRGRYLKSPSFWLRFLKHHYLAGFVTQPAYRPLVEMAGLWEEQRVINYWQNKVRNVLVFPYQSQDANQAALKYGANPPEPFRTGNKTTALLLVPQDLVVGLSPPLQEGEQFLAYRTRAEAVSLMEETGRRGLARILVVRTPEEVPALQASGSGPTRVPSLLVSDPATRLTWDQWQGLLARNMLGSFAQAEFLSTIQRDEMRDLFPVTKLKTYWTPFCFLSLREAMDEIMTLMIRTYEAMREVKCSDETRAELLKRVFRCLAQVWCARGLYFGAAAS